MTRCLLTPHIYTKILQMLVINFEAKGAWRVIWSDSLTSTEALARQQACVVMGFSKSWGKRPRKATMKTL